MGIFAKQIDKQIGAYQRELIETHYAEVENMSAPEACAETILEVYNEISDR